MNANFIPRLVPQFSLPAYAFVPGGPFPHPNRNRRAHGLDCPPLPALPPTADNWPRCLPYLYGIDLFNHGYYWEAHEVWEALWAQQGRLGPTADFLKGLIKLAAAAVKARAGEPRGVQSHARRAAERFRQVRAVLGGEGYLGLTWTDLIRVADDLGRNSGVRLLSSLACRQESEG